MTSLISIDSDKLIYNLKNNHQDVSKKVKVISVIGKARTGKSTLMNMLISYWTKKNTNIFKMSDSINHCTNGVDYYYLEESNIILLDFQGIYLGDSSQDCKLLLFAYLLSDVLIFNEKEMLSNMTLQQFQPMLSFMHYIDKTSLKNSKNPKLIFRICDVHLKLDPIENRNSMLHKQQDQFQSIRDCISELFDDITVIKTHSLERSELKLLNSENFLEMLKIDENNFETAITSIDDYIECIEPTRTFGQFMNDVNKITKSINNQEKIDCNKLDVFTNLTKLDIHDYINNLDKTIYDEIIVDGTQKLYEDNLLSRIFKKDKIIKDIYIKFNSVPKHILDDEVKKYFTDKIIPIIEKAEKQNKSISFEKLNKIIFKHFDIKQTKKQSGKNNNTTYELTYDFDEEDNNNSFQDIKPDNFTKPLVCIFNKIIKESENLLKSTYDIFIETKNKILKNITEDFMNQKNLIEQQYNICKNECEIYVQTIKSDFEKIILDKFNIDLDDDIDDYYTGFSEFVDKDISKIIQKDNNHNKIIELCSSFDVNEILKNQSITTKISKDDNDNDDYNYQYQALRDTINENIFEYIASHKDDIYNLISNERLKLLTDMKGNIDDKNGKIIEFNPYIKFVKFNINKEYLMTYQYYEQSLKIDFENICKICEKEGYINDWNKFIKQITDIKVINETTILVIDFDMYKEMCSDNYKNLVLFELFELEFKKYYAREKFIFAF